MNAIRSYLRVSDKFFPKAGDHFGTFKKSLVSLVYNYYEPLFKIVDYIDTRFGGARGVMAIVVGNGHGNTSSNPGGD